MSWSKHDKAKFYHRRKRSVCDRLGIDNFKNATVANLIRERFPECAKTSHKATINRFYAKYCTKARDKKRSRGSSAASQKGSPARRLRASPESHGFLKTYEWRRLRMVVLKKRGVRCECCGATPDDGVRINVDHVKPRRDFPELALDEDNLQVLCEDCNHGKGNWDHTDWRKDKGGTTEGASDEKPVFKRHPDTLPDVRPVGVSARYQRREDLREFGSAVERFLERRAPDTEGSSEE